MKEDIIQEILLRFPVKSLVRCKLLSKEWMEFISHNPAFRKSFIARNRGCSFMLGFYITKHMDLVDIDEKVHFLCTYNRGIRVLNKRKRDNDGVSLQLDARPAKKFFLSPPLLLKKSPSLFSDPAVRVLGSSNGFLLCSLDKKCPLNYIIINPINKLCMPLPVANTSSDYYTHGFICHSLSPLLDTVDYYKVVRGISPQDWHAESFTTLEIICSDSSQWSQYHVRGQSPFYLDSLNPSKIIISEAGLVYVPGTAFKEASTTPWTDGENNSVLIFDQNKEESVHVIELPLAENKVMHECFGQSEGMISYARNELGQLKVWRYNEQKGGGWSLIHNVSLNSWVGLLKKVGTASASGFCPEAFHPTDKNVIFLSRHPNRMVYNLNTSKMESVCDLKTQGLKSVYYFFPYTCGLIGPHLFLSQD
ncbi:hypothetical protein ACHQM5_030253 [Ranunculus cassubicifolius]